MNTTRRNNLILTGSLVLLLVAVVIFVALPLQNQLSVQHESLYLERIKSEIAELQVRNQQETAKEYARLQETTTTFENFFVTDETILAFISSLEKLALEAQVTQEIVNLQAPTTRPGQSAFDIHIIGSFTNVMTYIGTLEKSPYYIGIDQISLIPQTEGSIKASLKARIEWL